MYNIRSIKKNKTRTDKVWKSGKKFTKQNQLKKLSEDIAIRIATNK